MALSLILAAQMAVTTGPQLYRCLDQTMFTLSLSEKEAIVRFRDGQYRLPRRPSGIANKYSTDKATLYLDGDFAAFVADDRPLPGCTRVPPSGGATK
jgi:hypothetical protein